jgi:hypothetical protein
MSEELRSLIANAMTDLNPGDQDNQPVEADSEALDDSDFEVEDAVELEDEATEDLVDSEDDETEVEDEDSEEADDEPADKEDVHTVKVNGEVLEVSLKELKAGYQRQADYTREKQALKKQIEEFEEVSGTLVEAYEGLQSLEQAWEENPVTVLTQFFSTTENPTYAMALTIKELAVANLLDQDFLDMFGVTSDVKRQWAQETQSTRVQQEQKATGSRREQELAAAQEELEIQKAIAEYDRQIDEILDAEGLDFTVKQRAAFRKELATYAAENELTNLKAAYKAFKYEEAQTKKKAAAKTAAKAKDKKAASVVARSGAGADGASAVKDSSDLTSVIKAAMQDTQATLAK